MKRLSFAQLMHRTGSCLHSMADRQTCNLAGKAPGLEVSHLGKPFEILHAFIYFSLILYSKRLLNIYLYNLKELKNNLGHLGTYQVC